MQQDIVFDTNVDNILVSQMEEMTTRMRYQNKNIMGQSCSSVIFGGHYNLPGCQRVSRRERGLHDIDIDCMILLGTNILASRATNLAAPFPSADVAKCRS